MMTRLCRSAALCVLGRTGQRRRDRPHRDRAQAADMTTAEHGGASLAGPTTPHRLRRRFVGGASDHRRRAIGSPDSRHSTTEGLSWFGGGYRLLVRAARHVAVLSFGCRRHDDLTVSRQVLSARCLLSVAWGDEAGFIGQDDGLDAIAEREFGQDPGDVGLDGGFGKGQRRRDLAVGQATADVLEDLYLAGGQRLDLFGSPAGGRPADEFLDETAGYRRGEQRVTGGDGADGVGEVGSADVLEQEAAGSRSDGGVDVFVQVEGRQHEHPGRRRSAGDRFCCLDAVEYGHADVHQHDIGIQGSAGSDGLLAVGRLAHDLDVGLRVENHREAAANKFLVVDDQSSDHRSLSTGSRTLTA